jgi:hypothetical protein
VKLTTLCAVGIAYALGARAGRERYEQIRVLAQGAAKRMEAYGADGSLAARANDWWTSGSAPSRRSE